MPTALHRWTQKAVAQIYGVGPCRAFYGDMTLPVTRQAWVNAAAWVPSGGLSVALATQDDGARLLRLVPRL